MLILYAIAGVKPIHILSITIWFGPKLLVPADLRRAIAEGGTAMESAVRRVNLVQKVTVAASLVTLASGLGLIFLYGGFSRVPARIHVGLALTLAIFGLGAFGVDKAWARIRTGVKEGMSKPELEQHERRLSLLLTIENAVWGVILVLMVFRLEALF
jgi:hypothetical protein